jgi:hypothetical protein
MTEVAVHRWDFAGFHHPDRWCRACKEAGGNLSWDPLSHPTRRPDMRRLAAAVVVVALWAGPALAEDDSEKTQVKVIQEEDKVVVRKKTTVDFTDMAVEGELTKPEGSYVLNRKKTDFQSLIRVRDNFNPELQKSVDNL